MTIFRRSSSFGAGLVAVAAVTVACGGGNSSGTAGVSPSIQFGGVAPAVKARPTQAMSAPDKRKHRKKGELRIVVKIPPKYLRLPSGHVSVTQTFNKPDGQRRTRKPKYVSPSTRSMTVSVPGQMTQVFNLTPNSSACNVDQDTGHLTCSESAFFQSGEQTITITLYDQLDGQGNILSKATTTANIVAGSITYISITLNGVVASAVTLLDGGASASIPDGTPTSLPVMVNAYDADGNLIVSPGAYDASTPVTLSDSDTSGVTALSSTNVKRASSTLTLSYNGGAISSATITAKVQGVAQPNPATLTVTPAATPTPVASPGSLSFSTGATQTFSVQEPGYSGTLTASSSDTTVATVSPASASGPSATFTVSPIGGGTCTITVTDAQGNAAAVSVSVNGGVIIIDETPVATPTSLTFDTAASQTFAVKEKKYFGAFTETDNCSGIAGTSSSSANGPNATFTVAPINGGTCTISIADAQGNTATVGVSVSGGAITIDTKHGKHSHGGV